MKAHVKIALNARRLARGDLWPCEWCGKTMVIPTGMEVHHIYQRGMGGNPSCDVEENLIILCRDCHSKAEADESLREPMLGRVQSILGWWKGWYD